MTSYTISQDNQTQTINDSSSTVTIAGSGDNVTVNGNQNQISMTGGNDAVTIGSDNYSGFNAITDSSDNNTVTFGQFAFANSASLSGNGDTAIFSEGFSDSDSASFTGNNASVIFNEYGSSALFNGSGTSNARFTASVTVNANNANPNYSYNGVALNGSYVDFTENGPLNSTFGGASFTINGSHDAVTGHGTGQGFNDYGSFNTLNITGSLNGVNMYGDHGVATVSQTGDGGGVGLVGSNNSATYTSTGNISAGIVGSNDTITATAANGSSGSNFNVGGDHNTATFTMSNDGFSILNGGNFDSVNVTGDNNHFYLQVQDATHGHDNFFSMFGSHNTLTLNSWYDPSFVPTETVSGAGTFDLYGYVNLIVTNTTGAVISTHDRPDTVTLGAGNVNPTVTLVQPGDVLNITGSNIATTLNASNEVINVAGTNDSINLSGNGDTFNLTAAGASLTLGASSQTVNLTGNNQTATLTGNYDTVNVNGQNDQVTVASFETVKLNGSGETATLGNYDDVTGAGNDTITLGSTDTVNLTGGTNTVNSALGNLTGAHLTGGSGQDTLNVSGAGAFDLRGATIQGFEKLNLTNSEYFTLDDANWAVTAGANDTITMGAGNESITFTGTGDVVNAVLGVTIHAGDSLIGNHSTLKLTGAGSADVSGSPLNGFDNVYMAAHESIIFGANTITIYAANSGYDTFGFHQNIVANDTINYFLTSGDSHDIIDLDKSLLGGNTSTKAINQWESSHISQVGGNVVIHDGSNTITIVGQSLNAVEKCIVFV